MRNIIIVEPQSSGLKLVEQALEEGYQVWLASAEIGERNIPDSFKNKIAGIIHCDSMSADNIFQEVQKISVEKGINFEAVIPGFEYYVDVCAKVAKDLSLNSLDVENARCCRLKNLMRERLKQNKVDVPDFIFLKSEQTEQDIPSEFPFPAIIKPVNMSGSMHVYKVYSRAELAEKIKIIINSNDNDLDLAVSKELLIEEYIDGDEFSVEGIVNSLNGEIHIWSVTRKLLGGASGFVEIGHIVSDFSKLDNADQMIAYTKQVVLALGIDKGPFHAELSFCKKRKQPILMEIGARLAGDHLPELISEARGTSFFKSALNSLLMQDIEKPQLWQGASGICFLLRNQDQLTAKIEQKLDCIDWKYLKEMHWTVAHDTQIHGDFRDRICTARFYGENIIELEHEMKQFYELNQL
ncbi:ATP-grasp domain-containing protein [Fluviispira sanaruensis]|uniref:ATP-grasp domain-containing protein n=1 Tax=Fluviispira sanaruensis TaxID=2493639 RepID=A0A4P2VQL1_FLUSA|nr:ATP-grasp domain-containing protein [Fluviispira sanaruensis]BBH54319.1 hypothetical protein JCM31447_27830 [Fluviispira sanaruensis]